MVRFASTRRKAEQPNFHEILKDDEAFTPGSERSFGLVMAAVLALLALLALLRWFYEGHLVNRIPLTSTLSTLIFNLFYW